MIQFLSIGLLSLTLLVSCATPSADKKNLSDVHLRLGTAHLQQGNYPQALSELLLAVELDPNNAVARNNLALAYFVRERYPEAELHLKKALEIDPKYSDARNNLGRVYVAMKQYDSAIVELNIVSADLTYPTPEKALSNLALAYYRKGDYAKARDTSLNALKADKDFCPAQGIYGLSLFYLEDYKKAVHAFERTANQCEREKEEAHYYSGLSYYKLGSRDKAVARLQEVLTLYPEGEYTEKAKSILGIIK